jgi:hypothetical protein
MHTCMHRCFIDHRFWIAQADIIQGKFLATIFLDQHIMSSCPHQMLSSTGPPKVLVRACLFWSRASSKDFCLRSS